jgi:hypothetical protein
MCCVTMVLCQQPVVAPNLTVWLLAPAHVCCVDVLIVHVPSILVCVLPLFALCALIYVAEVLLHASTAGLSTLHLMGLPSANGSRSEQVRVECLQHHKPRLLYWLCAYVVFVLLQGPVGVLGHVPSSRVC